MNTPSKDYQQGFTDGRKDCEAEIYRPEICGRALGTPERAEWKAGYEAGWDAAFEGKVKQRIERRAVLIEAARELIFQDHH